MIEPVAGDVIGDFTVRARLGAGGMGAVYEAEDRRLGRVVALKLLGTGGSAERARDEARAAVRVRHPALVLVLDAGEDPRLGPWIAYERLPGQTLRDELASRGRIPAREVFDRIAVPLLGGMSALHAAGIVHRDVKPENLFRDSLGGYRLGDLGLARFRGREARTGTGVVMGTPGYVAPELALATADPSPAVDVYAAGALLVEALAGRLPWTGTSPSEQVAEQVRRDPGEAELTGMGVPGPWAGLLSRALRRDPTRRPASAAELLAGLDGSAPPPSGEGPSPLLAAGSRLGPVVHPPRRTWGGRAPAILLGALALGAVLLGLPGETRGPAPLPAADLRSLARAFAQVAPDQRPGIAAAVAARADSILADGAVADVRLAEADGAFKEELGGLAEAIGAARALAPPQGDPERGLLREAVFARWSSGAGRRAGGADPRALEAPLARAAALEPGAAASPAGRALRILLFALRVETLASGAGASAAARAALGVLLWWPGLPPRARPVLAETATRLATRPGLAGLELMVREDLGGARPESAHQAALVALAREGLEAARRARDTEGVGKSDFVWVGVDLAGYQAGLPERKRAATGHLAHLVEAAWLLRAAAILLEPDDLPAVWRALVWTEVAALRWRSSQDSAAMDVDEADLDGELPAKGLAGRSLKTLLELAAAVARLHARGDPDRAEAEGELMWAIREWFDEIAPRSPRETEPGLERLVGALRGHPGMAGFAVGLAAYHRRRHEESVAALWGTVADGLAAALAEENGERRRVRLENLHRAVDALWRSEQGRASWVESLQRAEGILETIDRIRRDPAPGAGPETAALLGEVEAKSLVRALAAARAGGLAGPERAFEARVRAAEADGRVSDWTRRAARAVLEGKTLALGVP